MNKINAWLPLGSAPAGHDLTEISPDTWSNGHLRFDFAPRAGGIPAWKVRMATASVEGPVVGYIRWNSVWQEYALLPRAGCVFAFDCLADISELLRRLNTTRSPKFTRSDQ